MLHLILPVIDDDCQMVRSNGVGRKLFPAQFSV
jgi:hypothetical protein